MELCFRLDETQSSELLNELLTAPNLPLKLVQELSRELILLHVKTTREGEERDDSLSARTRSLLVHVQQRYPIALANTSEQVLKETEEDKEIVEQLLLSLSVAFPIATTSAATASSSDIDAVVAATGADASVRAIAVRQLYGRLSEMDLPDLERVSTKIYVSHPRVVDDRRMPCARRFSPEYKTRMDLYSKHCMQHQSNSCRYRSVTSPHLSKLWR